MTTIKSYTDLEQSKRLEEILPLESADMHYKVMRSNNESNVSLIPYSNLGYYKNNDYQYCIPCWSLAALLNYLREIDFFPNIEADEHSVTMNINYYNEEEARLLAPIHNIKIEAESFVDACYELILKLHEQNLL